MLGSPEVLQEMSGPWGPGGVCPGSPGGWTTKGSVKLLRPCYEEKEGLYESVEEAIENGSLRVISVSSEVA